MNICIISDTHNKHNGLVLPDADVIIHCGDFTSMGKEHEIRNFMKWYSALKQFKYKIIIAGNHDRMFEYDRVYAKSLVPDNVIYLEDSGIEIEGINFYGTPVQINFCNWAFNKSEEQLKKHWEAIPDNTDVLITHSPPFGICDMVDGRHEHLGSPSLYDEVINRIQPKFQCFGHIHSAHGVKTIENITFINAAQLDETYMLRYKPIMIEI